MRDTPAPKGDPPAMAGARESPSPEKAPGAADAPLLEVEDLKKYFPVRKGLFGRIVGRIRAVDGISFEIRRGETLGLVGESGCGKTTAGRTILYLLGPPTAGKVRFRGVDVFSLGGKELRRMRRHMQIVFQDPYGSLNPRMTVEGIVGEGLTIHGIVRSRRERRERVQELLERVGLDPVRHLSRYPHEFSGGQRQRIGVARAIALRPEFIVCDEAVSALDVSIQAQILNLLCDLQKDLDLSYLFIAHDLSVVEHVSDRVAVMYLGGIVEVAPAEELYRNPLHPYTQALLSAVPTNDPRARGKREPLSGEPPTPLSPPPGCRFHPRCPFAEAECRAGDTPPEEIDVGNGHRVRCVLCRADRTPAGRRT